MKTNRSIVLAVLTMVAACGMALSFTAAANNKTIRYKVQDFNKINVSSAFKVKVVPGNAGLTVTVDEADAKYVRAYTKNGTLYLFLKNNHEVSFHSLKTKVMTAVISVSDLVAINVSGAVDVIVPEVIKTSTGEFSVKASGASDVNARCISDKVRIDASGASDITLEGNTVDLKVMSSGSSDVKTINLVTKNATLVVSGASDSSVNASDNLSVVASGASDVVYAGKPTIDMQCSGSSKVRPRREGKQ